MTNRLFKYSCHSVCNSSFTWHRADQDSEAKFELSRKCFHDELMMHRANQRMAAREACVCQTCKSSAWASEFNSGTAISGLVAYKRNFYISSLVLKLVLKCRCPEVLSSDEKVCLC